MISSQLKHIFLFCRHNLSTPSSFNPFTTLVLAVCPTGHMSQYIFVLNKLGEYVSCCRSCVYLSSNPLSSSWLFSTSSIYDFQNPTFWIFSIFNTLSFNLFTTNNNFILSSSLSTNTTFHEPIFLDFARDDISKIFRHIIFNLIHITPVTGHMREYKTLYRITLQFLGLDYVLMFLTV